MFWHVIIHLNHNSVYKYKHGIANILERLCNILTCHTPTIIQFVNGITFTLICKGQFSVATTSLDNSFV